MALSGPILFADCAKPQELAPAAKAATTEQRLKAVEDKTSFYVNTTTKLSQTYRKGRAGSAPWQCVNNAMVLAVDPKIRTAGMSYSWTTAAVKFTNLGVDPTFAMSVGLVRTDAARCTFNGSANGTYKKFCPVGIEPGDKFQFILTLSNEEGDLRPCDHVTLVDIGLKLVNVGIEEPK